MGHWGQIPTTSEWIYVDHEGLRYSKDGIYTKSGNGPFAQNQWDKHWEELLNRRENGVDQHLKKEGAVPFSQKVADWWKSKHREEKVRYEVDGEGGTKFDDTVCVSEEGEDNKDTEWLARGHAYKIGLAGKSC